MGQAKMAEVDAKPGEPHVDWARGGKKWVPVETEISEGGNPTHATFSEGNGGESRKSFHGYPDGFAQLIESPKTWSMTPMQIDTRNRDHGVSAADVTKCTNFTACAGPSSPTNAAWCSQRALLNAIGRSWVTLSQR